jgi:hypothetical protein
MLHLYNSVANEDGAQASASSDHVSSDIKEFIYLRIHQGINTAEM